MLEKRLLRFSEMCDQLAREARAMVFAVRSEAERIAADASEQVSIGKPSETNLPDSNKVAKPGKTRPRGKRRRSQDSLVRLKEYGYIYEGSTIRIVPGKIPPGADPEESRFSARITGDPSRPIWGHDGESVDSLTDVSKQLRDEHGVLLPQSKFNACRYWYIAGQSPERTLYDIARLMVL